MSITPAFSPGPQITHGAVVGSFFRWIRLDLYEQCSDHITEKMPSSVRLGSRPMALSTRSYSSAVKPCSATISGEMAAMAARLAGYAVPCQWRGRLMSDRRNDSEPGQGVEIFGDLLDRRGADCGGE